MSPTPTAAKKCAQWLQSCKDLGWRKEDMPRLCDIWWEFHDDEGALYPPGQSRVPLEQARLEAQTPLENYIGSLGLSDQPKDA